MRIGKFYLFRVKDICFIFNIKNNLLIDVNKKFYNKITESDYLHHISQEMLEKILNNYFKKDFSQIEYKPKKNRLFDMDSLSGNEAFSIYIIISRKCNFRCSYCWNNHGQFSKLNADDLPTSIGTNTIDNTLKFIKREKNMRNITINLYGGEPLLEWSMIKYFLEETRTLSREKNIRVILETNGSLLNDARVDWLYKYKKFLHINVSIDGTRDQHNKSRYDTLGIGTYDLVLNNLELIKNSGLEHSVLCVVTPPNFDFIGSAKALINLGVKNWNVSLMGTFRIDKYNKNDLYSTEQIKIIKERYLEFAEFYIQYVTNSNYIPKNRIYRAVRHILDSSQYVHCLAGYLGFAIDVVGDIFPCWSCIGIDALKMGNVKDFSLKNIKQNQANIKMEGRTTYSMDICKNCFLINKCDGICPQIWERVDNKEYFDAYVKENCKLTKEFFKIYCYMAAKLKHILQEGKSA